MKRNPRLLLLICVIVISLLLSGCSSSISRAEQGNCPQSVLLVEGHRLGQSFTPNFRGLDGISIFIASIDGVTADSQLQLDVFRNTLEPELLSSTSIPLGNPQPGRFFLIPLPSALPTSTSTDLRLDLSLIGPGELQLGSAPGEAYLEGALSRDGQPEDKQLCFLLSYRASALAGGLAGEVLGFLGLALVMAWLLLLPGMGLLSLIPITPSTPLWLRLCLAPGAGIAALAVWLLWTHLIGWQAGPLYAWAAPIASSIWLLWKNRASLRKPLKFPSIPHRDWLPLAVILLLLILITATRFWITRTWAGPLWGDAVQHTIIAQLITDHGGLFENWAPYTNLTSFTYHFGFHAVVSGINWLTGMQAIESILPAGQILNILAVLCLLPLGWRIAQSNWTIIGLLLLAGLLSPMPMYYSYWGRYTQLAGHIVICALAWLAWEILEQKQYSLRAILIVGLLSAGLGLTHYRILLLIIPIFLSIWLLNWANWRSSLVKITLTGLSGAILFLPWFIRTQGGTLVNTLLALLQPAQQAGIASPAEMNAIGPMNFFAPYGLWIAALLALAVLLWQRNRFAALLGLWSLGAILITNPDWFNLPGAGIITNFALALAAYMPISLLIAGAAGWFLQQPWAKALPIQVIGVALVLGGAVIGVNQRLADPGVASFTLLTQPDRRAFEWIDANTPEHSRFFVDGFFAYSGTIVAGSDAGWWLSFLSGHQSSLPPMLYVSEDNIPQWQDADINGLYNQISSAGLFDPATIAALQEQGFTHLYIGQQQGRVNSPRPLLVIDELSDNPAFELIYRADRVAIFAIQP